MEDFRKTKNAVKWSINISEEVNEKFEELMATQGKINKSKLMEYLLNEYIEKVKIED